MWSGVSYKLTIFIVDCASNVKCNLLEYFLLFKGGPSKGYVNKFTEIAKKNYSEYNVLGIDCNEYENLCKRYGFEGFKFGAVDCDEYQVICKNYDIKSSPSVLVFKGTQWSILPSFPSFDDVSKGIKDIKKKYDLSLLQTSYVPNPIERREKPKYE